MKLYTVCPLAALLLLSCAACKKDKTNTNLEGVWTSSYSARDDNDNDRIDPEEQDYFEDSKIQWRFSADGTVTIMEDGLAFLNGTYERYGDQLTIQYITFKEEYTITELNTHKLALQTYVEDWGRKLLVEKGLKR